MKSSSKNQAAQVANAEMALTYNPNGLLDCLIERLLLKNDAALSRQLNVAPPVISKIRHYRLPVGASILIRMHEVSGLSIRDLRYLMGDRRDTYFTGDYISSEGIPPDSGHDQQIQNAS